MNGRERLFAVLNGEPTDHTPIWLLFPYHPTGYYADVRSLPVYQPIFEASKKRAIMLNRRNPKVTVFDPEVYASLPVNLDKERIELELDDQMPAYRREMDEFPIEYGAMMLDIGEPVGHLYHASQLEEYSIWSLTHSDLVVDLLDRFQQQKRIFYRYCLERNLADVYFLVGSELASPPLVSRQTFLKWIVPYATELIERVHSYDKKVIQHYHGQIKRILPDFLTMQPDALHTIEAPPIGDCTFTEAYHVVGDRIVLIGNIQYDEFRRFTPAEMRAEVRAVLAECQGKRLILSPSAGPYEEELSPRQAENYLAFLEAGWGEDDH